MTKDETLLVFTLVVSSVSVFLFGILLFMVLISATRDFRERTKSKLVKIMIWAGIVVITFAIAVRNPLLKPFMISFPGSGKFLFHGIGIV
jgi:hypothetical protein